MTCSSLPLPTPSRPVMHGTDWGRLTIGSTVPPSPNLRLQADLHRSAALGAEQRALGSS